VLVIERVALKVPAAFGRKATLIWTLCPASMVIGRLGELREKLLVEIAMLLMVSDVDPEFVAVVEMVLLEPVLTLPKFKEADVNESLLLWCWTEEPLLMPWQLIKNDRTTSSNSKPTTLTEYRKRSCPAAVIASVGGKEWEHFGGGLILDSIKPLAFGGKDIGSTFLPWGAESQLLGYILRGRPVFWGDSSMHPIEFPVTMGRFLPTFFCVERSTATTAVLNFAEAVLPSL
jgi:hypothetical protein